jgi:hypothetical protein
LPCTVVWVAVTLMVGSRALFGGSAVSVVVPPVPVDEFAAGGGVCAPAPIQRHESNSAASPNIRNVGPSRPITTPRFNAGAV